MQTKLASLGLAVWLVGGGGCEGGNSHAGGRGGGGRAGLGGGRGGVRAGGGLILFTFLIILESNFNTNKINKQ